MSDKKTIEERIDDVVDKVSEKVAITQDKIAAAKENASNIAQDISKSVKKAVSESKDAVVDMMNKNK